MIRKVRRMLLIVAGGLAVLIIATLFGAFTARDRGVLLGRSENIVVQGAQRSFRLSAPSSTPTAIVIALHGYTGNGRQFAYYTAMHNAFGSDTVVVYPDAVASRRGEKTGWNAQFCCGSGWKNRVDDVAFLRALITELQKRFDVASNRVYLVGFSNGSFMAQRFATEYPELVGGVVAVSGTIGTTKNELKPKGPVPILLTHGVNDERVMYKGGESPGDPEFDWQSFDDTVNAWRTANQCGPAKPEVTKTANHVRSLYTDCAARLETIEYPNNAHKWDGWRLVNFWHQRSAASVEAAAFINRLDRSAK